MAGFTHWTELLVIAGFTFAISQILAIRARSRLPPGPTGLPLIGNLLQFPSTTPWHQFVLWKDQYGPVFSLNLAGQTMIVVNNGKMCADLMDKQSSIYSHRPELIVGNIMTGGLNLVLLTYNDLWRRLRKVAHEGLNIRVVQTYARIQEQEAALLTLAMLKLDNPEQWEEPIKRATASMTRTLIYGTSPISSSEDPVVRKINGFTETLARALAPGSHLVEFIPILDIFPAWLARWKRTAQEFYKDHSAAFTEFLDDVRRQHSDGSEQPSIALNLINNQKKHGMPDKTMDWLAAILFSTGSDTTAGTLTVFILAMSLYPEVQARAQEEIDAVVGRDRLPNASDAVKLPYVSAIVKETLRWRPIAPLGIPRRAAEDNWYNGYLIPKDAIVVANLWAMNRDPEIYPDYDEFRPERFTEGAGHAMPEGDSDTSATGRDHFTFGFGRRMCPGQHVAFQTLFVDIVTLLWTLSIQPIGEPPSKSKCVDNGLVVTPAPFPCKFELRHAASALGVQLLQECADRKE